MEAHSWPDDASVPIAPVVEQLVVACLVDTTSRRYNEAFMSCLRGSLDRAALEGSVQALVDRHPGLRQSYSVSEEGGLLCRQHPPGSVRAEVSFVDLQHCTSPADAQVQVVLRKAVRQPIPLTAPPLIHTTVVHLAGERHLLLFVYNHTAMDGQSRAIIIRELGALYSSQAAGGNAAAALPPLPFQPADFAAWQQKLLGDQALVERQLAYWRGKLAGAPALLQLPADKPRPPVASNQGAVLPFVLEGKVYEGVQALMKARRQSMVRVMSAAFMALLSRYSGQRDVVVMLPRSIRPEGGKGLVGHFINPMAIRVQLEEGDSFVGLVLKVAQSLKEAVANGDVTYQQVLDEVCTVRSRAYAPLAQAALTINEADQFATPELAGMVPEELDPSDTPSAGRSIADIQLKVRNCPGHILCHLEYNTDILEEPTVRRMAANLEAFLAAAVAEPESLVDSLPMVAPQEMELLLSAVQGPLQESFFHKPLLHLQFAATAARIPERPCLIAASGTLSFWQAQSTVGALAAAIRGMQLPPGAPVGLLLERSGEWVVAMLAALSTGHPFVPLEPSLPKGRLVWYLEDARPLGLLCSAGPEALAQAQALMELAGDAGKGISVMQVDCGSLSSTAAAPEVLNGAATQLDPASPAYIMFTSGSTGRPKGVMVTHGGLRDTALYTQEEWGMGPEDACLVTSSTAFDACIIQALAPVAAGVALVLVPPGLQTNPPLVVDLIQQHSPSLMIGIVPTLLREYLLELSGRQGTWVPGEGRRVCVGAAGEQLPADLVKLVWQVMPSVALFENMYGPTEVTVSTVSGKVPKDVARICIGTPETNVHAYIVDSQMQLLPLGAAGELLLSGPRLAAGYVGRPDLTAEKFVPNPFLEDVLPLLPPRVHEHYRLVYRTGDLVAWRRDSSGKYQLELLGRLDRQTKINGVRMELAEVETVVAAAPGVSVSVVMPRKSPAGRDVLVAYTVPSTVDAAAVLQFCRDHLHPAMVPAMVIPLPALPLNPSGKIDMVALPDPFLGSGSGGGGGSSGTPGEAQGGADVAAAYVAPANQVEEVLQRIWTENLRLGQPISTAADYFVMGGTSLQLFRLVAAMQRELGLTALPTTLVYTTRTIQSTAKLLAESPDLWESDGMEGGAAGIPKQEWESPRRPLSANQEQMWVLQQQGMGSAYSMQMVKCLNGSLDTEALEASLQFVLERHEVLRMRLVQEADGTLVGEVLPVGAVQVPLRVADCGTDPAELRAVFAAEMSEGFDLSSPPLMRAVLLRHKSAAGDNQLQNGQQQQQQQQYTLCMTMHHAVGDGWSWGVFMADLSAKYQCICRAAAASSKASSGGAGGGSTGSNGSLSVPLPPPLPIQYGDFAKWQQQLLADAEAVAQLQRYWREQLQGCVPALQLATDRPRPQEPRYSAGVLQSSLGREALAAAKQLASSLQVSTQAVVLAALQVVLLRYCGQDEVTIGMPTAGRQQPETHPLVGYFITPVPIRAAPQEGATFAEVVRCAGAAMLGALSHAALPFQYVVEASGVPRQAGMNPLFQVMFQLFGEGENDPALRLPGVETSPVPKEALPAPAQAKVDLYFFVDAQGGLQVEYMDELFDPATVEQLAGSLRVVLSHGTANPSTPIASIPLLDSQEVQEVVQRYSCSELRPEFLAGALTHEMFEKVAAASPGSPCLVFEGQVLTYQQVNSQANQLAHSLLEAGVCADSPVALLLDRSSEYVVAVLAVLKAGGCFLPCDPAYPPDRLAAYVEDAHPAAMLAQARHRALADSLVDAGQPSCKVLVIEECWASQHSTANPARQVSPSNLALVLFTSGSTGRPKGVMLTHLGLAEFLRSVVDIHGFTSTDVCIFSSTAGFDMHIYQMFPPLVVGGHLVVAAPDGHTDPRYILSLIQSWHVTVMMTVPSLGFLYLDEPGAQQCTSLRLLLFGGEPLTCKLAGLAQAMVPWAKVRNCYGPTESTVYVTQSLIEPGCQCINLGKPEPNVHAFVTTAWGSSKDAVQQQPGGLDLAPVGVPGELLVAGPRLAAGYVGRPDLTAAAFVPNPYRGLMEAQLPEHMRAHYQVMYRTGDLVRWRRDGTIDFLGRVDHQTKINGVRMELGEIDAVLATAPGVVNGVTVTQAIGKDDRKRLVAYVAPAGVDSAAVQAHCRSKLIPAMVPAVVVVLDKLPLLPNGKVNRKVLPPPPELDAANLEEEYVAPRDEVEAAVQEVWMTVLGHEQPISIVADFFAVGGSSLKAGVIQARLREGLGVPGLSGTALMQHPTIERLAEHIKSMAEGAAAGGGGRGPKRSTSWGPALLVKGFSQRWLAGHGSSTQLLLARARTFRSERLLDYLSAEDPRLPWRFGGGKGGGKGGPGSASMRRGQLPPAAPVLQPTRLPYPVYLLLQYLLLTASQLPFLVAWVGALLLLAAAYRGVGTWWLVLLWAPIGVTKSVLVCVLSVVLSWMLFPRGLEPGVHPLYGWMHCRWATARATHRRALSSVLYFTSRTPMLSWLYRLWGAEIGQGAILDTGCIYDPQLLSVGPGSKVGSGAMVAGALVAPAGMVDPQAPALLLSQVRIGAGCEVGHKAVLPAGARLADGYHLKPRAAPSHPGAVGKGPLTTTPEFCPEEHLGPALSTLCALLSLMLHYVATLPGVMANFALMGCILDQNPFEVLNERLFNRWTLGSNHLEWPLVVWPTLFTALYLFLTLPISAAVHTLVLVAYKRLVLGKLPPGTRITRSRWLLLRFALYGRLLEDELQGTLHTLTFGTTIPGTICRWLGSSVGPDVFMGGLHFACHDGVTVGTRASSGGESYAYCIDSEGVVQSLVIGAGATVGNSAVLYPGCRLAPGSLVGNDTVLPAGAELEGRVRLQGTVRYTVAAAEADIDVEKAGEGRAGKAAAPRAVAGGAKQGQDPSKGQSKGQDKGQAKGEMKSTQGQQPGGGLRPDEAAAIAGMEAAPRWHSPRMVLTMLLLDPIVPLLRWSCVTFTMVLVAEVAGWVALAVYAVQLVAGLALATLWLKMLPSLVGMQRHWREGSAPVFSVSAAIVHSTLSNPIYDILLDTPIMAWIYRALGFKVGEGAVVMGRLPLERGLVSIGAGAVVESWAFVEGHFMEQMAFSYRPCSVEERAWVQQSSRVMPGVVMGAGARLLPGSTVLPGEALGKGTLWGGGVPASPQGG